MDRRVLETKPAKKRMQSKRQSCFTSSRCPAKLRPVQRPEYQSCVSRDLGPRFPGSVRGGGRGPRAARARTSGPESWQLCGTYLRAPRLQRRDAACCPGTSGRGPGAAPRRSSAPRWVGACSGHLSGRQPASLKGSAEKEDHEVQ